jgi:hypothetical protein
MKTKNFAKGRHIYSCHYCGAEIPRDQVKTSWLTLISSGCGAARREWFCGFTCVDSYMHDRILGYEKTVLIVLKRNNDSLAREYRPVRNPSKTKVKK